MITLYYKHIKLLNLFLGIILIVLIIVGLWGEVRAREETMGIIAEIESLKKSDRYVALLEEKIQVEQELLKYKETNLEATIKPSAFKKQPLLLSSKQISKEKKAALSEDVQILPRNIHENTIHREFILEQVGFVTEMKQLSRLQLRLFDNLKRSRVKDEIHDLLIQQAVLTKKLSEIYTKKNTEEILFLRKHQIELADEIVESTKQLIDTIDSPKLRRSRYHEQKMKELAHDQIDLAKQMITSIKISLAD